MLSEKKIKGEIGLLRGLKSLVDVYEEIAAVRMQRVRGAVLTSRQFLEEIAAVFYRVRAAYRKEKVTGAWAKNGKTVAVFVSANAGLYGDIVDRIFNEFARYVKENNPEVVVIGKLGVRMMADRRMNVLYNYFDFSDDEVETESFMLVMRYLVQFEKIVVFYGKFKSILSQEVEFTALSGESVEVQEAKQETEAKERYLFEPSAESIARIFEGEILASMFEQALHESQLAKFASRMMNLDGSMGNIEKRLLEVSLERRRLRHKKINSKELSRLGRTDLWV